MLYFKETPSNSHEADSVEPLDAVDLIPEDNSTAWLDEVLAESEDKNPDRQPEHRYRDDPSSYRWLKTEMGRGGLTGLFLRGSEVVYTPRVGEDGYIEAPTEDDDNGRFTVSPATRDLITARLAAKYMIYKTVKDKNGNESVKRQLMPANVVVTALADIAASGREAAPSLPRLAGVTHTPIVRADGSVLTTPGYDERSGFLYAPTVDVPPVSVQPTVNELAAATVLLRGLVSEFKWDGDERQRANYEANYLGLLLTPLLRLLCPPPYKAGVISAPMPGSGKTLLAGIARTVHGGVFRSEFPRDEAELAKSITGILHTTTSPIVVFDNVTGLVKSSRLDGLLTSAVWSDRVLGSTNNIEMPNDRVWMITGNNASLGGDLKRRHVPVVINPRQDNPHLRTTFRIMDLERHVTAQRGEILAALLTWVTAWVAAGARKGLHTSDGYSVWSGTVRGILTNAGVPGTFDDPKDADVLTGSTTDEGWGGWLAALREVFGEGQFTTGDVMTGIKKPYPHPTPNPLIDALPDQLHEKFNRANPDLINRSLGRWFMNRRGRYADGRVVVEVGRNGNGKPLWQVMTQDELSAQQSA